MPYRRHGIGKTLMDYAKKKAKGIECRAIILETQSCNVNAIAFYTAQGLRLFGFDRSCYGNKDIENHEVRLELGLYL
jgi:ribosomal protein S18 acetylase RimI-like enzyme